MIKQFLISLIILLIMSFAFCYNEVFAATEIHVSSTLEDSTITSGSEVVINISINKLNGIDGGVNAYIFSLDFGTDDFEFVKIEGQNNWNSPAYNETKLKEGTVKFAATRANFTTQTGTIAKLTLKAKKNLNNKPKVEIYNISFAGKINNTTQKVVANNVTVSLNINQGNENNGNLNNNGQDSGGELNSSNNDTSNKKLPGAGTRKQIYVLPFGILTISSYFIYKKLYKGI